jgi:hypothetical protein
MVANLVELLMGIRAAGILRVHALIPKGKLVLGGKCSSKKSPPSVRWWYGTVLTVAKRGSTIFL